MASITQAEHTLKSTAAFVDSATDAAGVMAGTDALATITKSLPVGGAIFTVFHSIIEIAQNARHNKDNCKRAATRCEGLELVIYTCATEYCRRGGPKDKHLDALRRLLGLVEKLKELVLIHSSKGKVFPERYTV